MSANDQNNFQDFNTANINFPNVVKLQVFHGLPQQQQQQQSVFLGQKSSPSKTLPRERKVSIQDDRRKDSVKQRDRPRKMMRGLTVDSSHLDDIDDLDFKMPEVDLDVSGIDMGEEEEY